MQERQEYKTKCCCAKRAQAQCGCHSQGIMKKKPDNPISRSRSTLENKKNKPKCEWVKIKHEYDTYGPLSTTSYMDSRRNSTTTTVSSSSGVNYCSCSTGSNSSSRVSSSKSLSVSNKCKFGELNKLKYSNQRSFYENLRKQSELQHVDLGVAGAMNVIGSNKQQQTDCYEIKQFTVKPLKTTTTTTTTTRRKPTTDIYDRAYVRSLQEFRLRNRKECFYE